MNNSSRDVQKQFSIEEDKPSDWFDPLYASSNREGEGVPWANMKTHPSFARWLSENPLLGEGKAALVVGCGFGDDAIELESLGFRVTAFDVSSAAIGFCQERFPDSTVDFMPADLLSHQTQWERQFDFVLEIFTVQALPPKYEGEAVKNIASFVKPGGCLLVVAEVGGESRTYENGPPWLLTPDHIDLFASCGLRVNTKTVESSSAENGSVTYVTAFDSPGE